MPANLTTVNNILKEYYLGPVQEQLNNEVLLVQRLESRSEDLVGKAAFVPLHTGRSSGIGAIAESAILPSAGSQSYKRAEYDLKYLYGRVQVTGPSMAKTKSDAGSFLQILRSELDGIRNDLKKDLARQVYGAGDGVLAAAGATSITPNGSQTSGTDIVITLSDWQPLRKGQVYVGQVLDLVTYSSGTPTVVATAVPVKAVSYIGATSTTSTVTITLNATVTVPTGTATLVRSGALNTAALQNRYATATRSNEVDGLARIVTSAAPSSSTVGNSGYQTVGSIDAYDQTFWDNQRVAVGGALTLQAIQQGVNLSRTQAGTPTIMITSLGVMREFYRLLTFTDGSGVSPNYIVNRDQGDGALKAGFQSISYNGVPVVGDIDAPYGTMYMLDESTLKVFSDQDWHFLDADGQTLRQVPNYDAFEAVMARYMNLGATNRTKNVVLTGITVNGNTDNGV
jgi:hypothetical protein